MLKSKKTKAAAAAVVGIVLVAPAFARSYTINGPSMAPSLRYGDVAIAFLAAYDLRFPYTDKVLLRTGEPARGDVIIYYDRSKQAVAAKRVVGLPGDRVEVRDHTLFLNGELATQETLPADEVAGLPVGKHPLGDVVAVERLDDKSYLVSYSRGQHDLADHGPAVVPTGKYFLLGDRRDNSADSRLIGCIDREQVKGRVVYGERSRRP